MKGHFNVIRCYEELITEIQYNDKGVNAKSMLFSLHETEKKLFTIIVFSDKNALKGVLKGRDHKGRHLKDSATASIQVYYRRTVIFLVQYDAISQCSTLVRNTVVRATFKVNGKPPILGSRSPLTP